MKAPLQLDTASRIDEDGNLVVSTSIASGTGFIRLLEAPWYRLQVEDDPTLIGNTQFVGAMESNSTFLSPARAQKLDLTFYGTGGGAQVRLSSGSEVLPYLAANAVHR